MCGKKARAVAEGILEGYAADLDGMSGMMLCGHGLHIACAITSDCSGTGKRAS